MINIKHLLFPALFITIISCSENKFPEKVWDEAGYNAATGIKHGVTAFDASRINYKVSGKTTLEITIDAPVVVGVAEKPESWGFFQFPQIYRTNDNLLVATWQMAPDDASSYGKDAKGTAVSADNGKTWSAPGGESVTGGGFLLPNGDRIRIDTPKALKAGELDLPDSVSSNTENYGRTFVYYKMNLLPEELQGVYLSRMAKGTGIWTPEHNLLKDRDAVRYTDSGLFPVVWWGDFVLAPDESVITGIYPGFCLNDENRVEPSGILFYRSEDYGHSWNIHGRIQYVPDLKTDPNGDKRLALGFTEPASIMLKNGTYLCVMRTSDGLGDSPMYISKSIDIGLSWTKPVTFTGSGVLPRLLQLDNGVIVLASGRPGVQLRFCTDGKGEKWTDPFEMLPFENEKDAVSCGYTEIIPSGPDSFILIYSDFKHKTDNGELRKAIKVRHISVHQK